MRLFFCPAKKTAAVLWTVAMFCLWNAAGAEAAVEYKVAVESDGVGATENAFYKEGNTVTIKAGTAPDGHKFKMWTTVNKGVSFDDMYSDSTAFTMPGHNVTVTAFFVKTITDARDGNVYGVVEIGNQKWMGENLKYKPQSGNSWCYENSLDSCDKYGRLYNWETAAASCPTGWVLPDTADWGRLSKAVDASGKKLKAKNGWKWSGDYNVGTDDFGFSALSGGYFYQEGGYSEFGGVGEYGFWWGATRKSNGEANFLIMTNGSDNMNFNSFADRYNWFSVRCVAEKAPGTFVSLEINTTYSPSLSLNHFTLPKGYVWDSSVKPTDHLNAGDGQKFAATFTDTSGNYTTVSGFITVNVAKATGLTEIAPTALKIASGNTAAKTFDLSGIVLYPTDHGELSYSLGEETDEGPDGKILMRSPTLSGSLLSYQGGGKTEGTATQVIKITSRNYEDIYITVTFEATPEAVYNVTVKNGSGGGSYAAGDDVVITAAPAEPGKVFAEWTASDGVTIIPDSKAADAKFTMPDKDVTVTAVYDDTDYMIRFYGPCFDKCHPMFSTDGWNVLSDIRTDGGGKILSLPPEQWFDGYTFAGWYTEKEGGTAVVAGHVFTKDSYVYARFTPTGFKVTWKADGGAPQPAQNIVMPTENIDAPDMMTKLGYTFGGWYYDAALYDPVTFPIENVKRDFTFYAKWKMDSYIVEWFTNGGTSEPFLVSAVTYGGSITGSPGSAGSKEGHVFDGWYLEPDLTAMATFPVRDVTGDKAFYAKWTPVYTVTFDPDSGTVSPTSALTGAGGKLAWLPEPVRSGYTFAGWYTAKTEGGARVTTDREFEADETIYARWTVTTCTVTFDFPDGGTAFPSSITAGANGKLPYWPITTPPSSSTYNYVFDGWYTSNTDGVKVDTGAIVFNKDTVIYGRWTAVPIFAITFNPNGGAVNPTNGATGADSTLKVTLPTPTRAGYAFDGWHTDPTGGELVTLSTKFAANAVVYAHWTSGPAASYTIVFNANGGTVNTTSGETGADGTLKSSLPVPTRSGYNFDAWYTRPTAGAKVTQSTAFTSNDTIYAHWTLPTMFLIRFNANGGTVSRALDTTGIDGKLASLPTPVAANNGEAFDGWFTELTGGAKVTTSYVFTEDATLYARWTPVAVSYIITFNPNGNGGLVNPTSRVTTGDGTLASLPTPVRENYRFTGWFTSAAIGGAEITTDYVFTGNTTIYARWTPIYTVTFNPNNGTVSPTSAKVNTDGLLEADLPTPTRAGYKFDGWFTTPAATGGLEVTADYEFSANTTIYARWTLVTYTIVFDPNGGTVSVLSGVTGTGGMLASLPAPSARAGYVFDGWFTEEVGGTKVTTSTAFTGDATVYAQWSLIYKVTFDPNGGVVTTASANTGAGGKLTSLPTPTLKDYTFGGWFTEEDGGTIVTTSTVFDGDATIYARWLLFTHAKVTFSAGFGGILRATVDVIPITSGDSVAIGKDIVFMAVPYDGYKVAGWTINGSAVVDTSYTYVIAGVSNAATISVSFEPRTSVASPDREIPSGAVGGEVVAIAPVKVLSGGVTVGPNPVRVGGDVAIYWTGGKAVKGSLSVFDAVGQKVARVDVRGTKKIGTWRVGDVAEGTYLIKGLLTDKNGVRVVVSVLVGVVR
jgi:uncharacterized protein (TIGR02145 family)/uncharacterized repeat protein (TIGR02543 family)